MPIQRIMSQNSSENPKPTAAVNTQKIDSLTGLRALAATMVVLGHITNYNLLGDFWIFKYGWTGVNIFFVLSGFLFTYLYLDKFTEGTQSLKEFFLKRIFRIYPLYLLILCITLFTRFGQYSFWDIVTHLTMTHGFFKPFRESINIPMWTLSTEESFYLLIPFLLFLFGTVWNKFRSKSDYVKLAVITALFFVFQFAGIGIMEYILVFTTNWLGQARDSGLFTTIFGRYGDFGLGIVLGFLVLKFPNSPLLKNKLLANLNFIFGVAIFYFASQWLEMHGGTAKPNGNYFSFTTALNSYKYGAFLIILSLVGNSVFNKLFSLKFIVYLGQISFALYLFHYVNYYDINDLASFTKFFLRYSLNSEFWSVVATLVIMNIAAALLYHIVEIPAQNFLRNRYLNGK